MCPSCRHTRNASAVFKIFVLHPKKTFATISARSGRSLELHSPAQGRGMNRRIPEALHILVKHRYSRRTTGHIERRAKLADQRARNDNAPLLEPFAAPTAP